MGFKKMRRYLAMAALGAVLYSCPAYAQDDEEEVEGKVIAITNETNNTIAQLLVGPVIGSDPELENVAPDGLPDGETVFVIEPDTSRTCTWRVAVVWSGDDVEEVDTDFCAVTALTLHYDTERDGTTLTAD